MSVSRVTLPEVDRLSVTTVVDNSIDAVRVDEKVTRRWNITRARKWTTWSRSTAPASRPLSP